MFIFIHKLTENLKKLIHQFRSNE
uniref:Uncharacterized protein n=1 Tax=Arundo donax TaxID=35708 RepID=A0A0A9FJ38_ARUDO